MTARNTNEFFLAIRRGDFKTIGAILTQNRALSLIENENTQLLAVHEAAAFNQINSVIVLYALRVNLWQRTSLEAKTILHICAENDYIELGVQISLLPINEEIGNHDYYAEDNNGQRFRDLFTSPHSLEKFNELRTQYRNLIGTIDRNVVDNFSFLNFQEHSAIFQFVNKDLQKPLDVCVLQGKFNMAEQLINEGAGLSIIRRSQRESAAHVLARFRPELLQRLKLNTEQLMWRNERDETVQELVLRANSTRSDYFNSLMPNNNAQIEELCVKIKQMETQETGQMTQLINLLQKLAPQNRKKNLEKEIEEVRELIVPPPALADQQEEGGKSTTAANKAGGTLPEDIQEFRRQQTKITQDLFDFIEFESQNLLSRVAQRVQHIVTDETATRPNILSGAASAVNAAEQRSVRIQTKIQSLEEHVDFTWDKIGQTIAQRLDEIKGRHAKFMKRAGLKRLQNDVADIKDKLGVLEINFNLFQTRTANKIEQTTRRIDRLETSINESQYARAVETERPRRAPDDLGARDRTAGEAQPEEVHCTKHPNQLLMRHSVFVPCKHRACQTCNREKLCWKCNKEVTDIIVPKLNFNRR